MDFAAQHSRRADLQYRRLFDALDQRRVCVNAASRGQSCGTRTLLNCVFSRPESGCGGSVFAELREL